MKVRICPYDDYSNDPGTPLERELERAFLDEDRGRERMADALAKVVTILVDADVIPASEIIAIMNYGRDYQSGRWEVVE